MAFGEEGNLPRRPRGVKAEAPGVPAGALIACSLTAARLSCSFRCSRAGCSQGVKAGAPGFPRDPFCVLPESCPARVFSEMAGHGVLGGEEFP